MNILERIVNRKRSRLAEAQARLPLAELCRLLEKNEEGNARRPLPLTPDGFHVIAEVKRASPSLGVIPWSRDLIALVDSYRRGGAGVISVLTEEDFFHGSVRDLQEVGSLCDLPLLRKDFLFTEYQIVESKVIGASAVLLIATLLSGKQLNALLRLAEELGMEALVECRDEKEVECALEAGARIVGINNRDLRTFTVSLERTERLAPLIPPGVVLVSESGITSPGDAARVAKAGAAAVLVGEACIRHADPAAFIAGLLQSGRTQKNRLAQGGKEEC